MYIINNKQINRKTDSFEVKSINTIIVSNSKKESADKQEKIRIPVMINMKKSSFLNKNKLSNQSVTKKNTEFNKKLKNVTTLNTLKLIKAFDTDNENKNENENENQSEDIDNNAFFGNPQKKTDEKVEIILNKHVNELIKLKRIRNSIRANNFKSNHRKSNARRSIQNIIQTKEIKKKSLLSKIWKSIENYYYLGNDKNVEVVLKEYLTNKKKKQ
jgi:hypothetical protein